MSEHSESSRLTRLEESLAYADRAAEEAGRQVVDLYRRLDLLARRVESLEMRLEAAAHADSPEAATRPLTNEELRQHRPPHSA
jgi:hypothetical protein